MEKQQSSTDAVLDAHANVTLKIAEQTNYQFPSLKLPKYARQEEYLTCEDGRALRANFGALSPIMLTIITADMCMCLCTWISTCSPLQCVLASFVGPTVEFAERFPRGV